jgi:ATP-dependent RNA helicase DDX27
MQKLYLERGNYQKYIRVLIIIPTRELAMQCYDMFLQFNTYTQIKGSLVIGAANLRKQEQDLRMQPEIVIATPGRILDLIKNSQNIDLDNIDVLVFDEADKLLELGFEIEIAELCKSINPNR